MKLLSLDEYKETIVRIMFVIDQICREHNLTYMIFYGTLLGAVRHKGLIPWDDDIDIVMPRKDYDKLAEIINKGNYSLRFIDIKYNPDTIYIWGKICDKQTELHEKNFKPVNGYGAFVDVFPLDYAPNDERRRQKEKKHLRRLALLETHSARNGFEHGKSFKTNVLRGLAYGFSRLFSPQFLIKTINRYVITRDKIPTDYYRVYGGGIFPIEWLNKTIDIEFEGQMMKAPHDPDMVLRACFGDYMKLPPKEEQVCKHTLQCYLLDD